MKLSIEDIQSVLNDTVSNDAEIKAALIKLNEIAAELKNEPKEPKSKNQYGIVVFEGTETGLVVQMLESEDIGLTLSKISNAARNYNQTKKGLKKPVLTIADAANLKRSFLKNEGINIKTKNPVRVIVSQNNLV